MDPDPIDDPYDYDLPRPASLRCWHSLLGAGHPITLRFRLPARAPLPALSSPHRTHRQPQAQAIIQLQ